jgi:hypothetical protein
VNRQPPPQLMHAGASWTYQRTKVTGYSNHP